MKKIMIAIFMLACGQLELDASYVTTSMAAYDVDPSNGANMSITGNIYTSYDGVTEFLVKNSGKIYTITAPTSMDEPTKNIIAYNPGIFHPSMNASLFKWALTENAGSYLDQGAFNAVWGDSGVMKADGATKTDANGNLDELTTTLLYHLTYNNSTDLKYDYARTVQTGTIVNQIGRTGVGIFEGMDDCSVVFTYYTPIYGTEISTSTFKSNTQSSLGTVTLDTTSISYNSIFQTAIDEVTDIDDDGNNYTYYNYYTGCVVYDGPATNLGDYTSLGTYTNNNGTYYVYGMTATLADYNSANRVIDGVTVAYS